MDTWNMIAQLPANQQQYEYDAINGSSIMYNKKKKYFQNSPCPYLFEGTNVLRYDERKNTIIDAHIRGQVGLCYTVTIE